MNRPMLSAQGMGLWLKRMLAGVLAFAWWLNWPLNEALGVPGYSAPLPLSLSPQDLWWLASPMLLTAVWMTQRIARGLTPFPSNPEQSPDAAAMALLLLPVSAGICLFWLWVHSAAAWLAPASVFFVALAFAQLMRAPPAALRTAPGLSPASTGERQRETHAGAGGGVRYSAAAARYSFTDVDGMQAIRRKLKSFGKEAMLLREQLPHGEKTRNGALLYGAPGNGKTFIAEALAGELGIPLLSVSIAELQSMYVGETTERLVQVCRDARTQAPCLLFLDEIDAVLVERGGVRNADSESSRTVNALLTELVRLRMSGVVIVAATNHPEKLDGAGKREGRFDLKVHIPTPDFEARIGILRRGMGDKVRCDKAMMECASRHFASFSVARLMAIAELLRRRSLVEPDKPFVVVGEAALQQALRLVQGVATQNSDAPDLDELVLSAATRQTLQRLAAMMRDGWNLERQGGKLPRGAAFYGPPGTGKTLAARALAKASGWAFLPTTGQDLLRERAMDDLIAQASDRRPAVVFIDEADDILGERRFSGVKMATNKLLTLIDGADEASPDVLFVVATNNPEDLDAASQRRFTIKAAFTPPEPDQVVAWVRQWRQGLAIAATVEVDEVARLLNGMSMADITAVLQDALNIAISSGKALGIEHVRESCRNVKGWLEHSGLARLRSVG